MERYMVVFPRDFSLCIWVSLVFLYLQISSVVAWVSLFDDLGFWVEMRKQVSLKYWGLLLFI